MYFSLSSNSIGTVVFLSFFFSPIVGVCIAVNVLNKGLGLKLQTVLCFTNFYFPL
jgi:hypothetical protein